MAFRIHGRNDLEATAGRRAFGLLFGSAGILMAVAAVFAYRAHAPAHALGILGVFALLFLFVGALLFFQYDRLSLRGDRLTLTRRRLGETTVARASRSALRAVRVEAAVVRTSKGGARTVYHVTLELNAPGFPQRFRVATCNQEDRAFRQAVRLAKALDLPLVDAVGDRPIRIDPHHLRPVAWLDGKRPKPEPVHLEVRGSLPQELLARLALVATMLFLDIPLVVMILYAFLGFNAKALALIGAAVAIPGIAFAMWLAYRTHLAETVDAADGVIEVRTRLGSRTIRRLRLRPSTVRRIRAHTDRSAAGRGLLIQTADRKVWTLRGADADTIRAAASRLAAFVDAYS